MKILAVVAFVAGVTIASSAGAVELLQNGSFENPNIGGVNYPFPGGPGYNYPAGVLAAWDYQGSALINASGSSLWYGGTPPAGQDGAQFAGLQGQSGLAQSFNVSHADATVSWLSAGRSYNGGVQNYTVSLIDNTHAAGTILVGNYFTLAGTDFASNSQAVHGLIAGDYYTLQFQGLAETDQTAFIDAVSVSAVPEPAIWAMMVGGLAMLGLMLRRRRNGAMSGLTLA